MRSSPEQGQLPAAFVSEHVDLLHTKGPQTLQSMDVQAAYGNELVGAAARRQIVNAARVCAEDCVAEIEDFISPDVERVRAYESDHSRKPLLEQLEEWLTVAQRYDPQVIDTVCGWLTDMMLDYDPEGYASDLAAIGVDPERATELHLQEQGHELARHSLGLFRRFDTNPDRLWELANSPFMRQYAVERDAAGLSRSPFAWAAFMIHAGSRQADPVRREDAFGAATAEIEAFFDKKWTVGYGELPEPDHDLALSLLARYDAERYRYLISRFPMYTAEICQPAERADASTPPAARTENQRSLMADHQQRIMTEGGPDDLSQWIQGRYSSEGAIDLSALERLSRLYMSVSPSKRKGEAEVVLATFLPTEALLEHVRRHPGLLLGSTSASAIVVRRLARTKHTGLAAQFVERRRKHRGIHDQDEAAAEAAGHHLATYEETGNESAYTAAQKLLGSAALRRLLHALPEQAYHLAARKYTAVTKQQHSSRQAHVRGVLNAYHQSRVISPDITQPMRVQLELDLGELAQAAKQYDILTKTPHKSSAVAFMSGLDLLAAYCRVGQEERALQFLESRILPLATGKADRLQEALALWRTQGERHVSNYAIRLDPTAPYAHLKPGAAW